MGLKPLDDSEESIKAEEEAAAPADEEENENIEIDTGFEKEKEEFEAVTKLREERPLVRNFEKSRPSSASTNVTA